ncbi:MAG: hypothetical protein HC907_09425 [Richelia sp. SM1_7_0]|nr:hypothetical protein [Richelia sp. SM1_7_0]
MSSGKDRAMLKTADGATWLTTDELMNTVRGLLKLRKQWMGMRWKFP